MSIISTSVHRLQQADILHRSGDGNYRAAPGYILRLHSGSILETITSIELSENHTRVHFDSGMAQFPSHRFPVRIFKELDEI